MVVLRDPTDVERVSDPFIKALLVQRFQDIHLPGYRWADLGCFVLVQPGDAVSEIEAQSGAWITTGVFGDTRYGMPDFSPSFETLLHHVGHCFELAEITNDDGYCILVIIPEVPGIDEELLRFCRDYAQVAEVSPCSASCFVYVPET